MQTWLRIMIALVFALVTGLVSGAVQPAASQGSLRVGIQAGHYNGRAGASSCDGTVREEDINWAVANQAANLLRQSGLQVDVLEGRPDTVAGYQANAFVALHTDYCAGSNSGYKVGRWMGARGSGLDGSNDPSDQLAARLWEDYGASTGLPQDHSPDHYTVDMLQYYALNPVGGVNPQTPAAIIEMGWLSGDLAFMTSTSGQAQMAQGIANAVLRFLGLPTLGQPGVTPPSTGLGLTATALVVDVSGSMGTPWQGGIKIESARSAAHQVLNMLSQESQVDGGGHRAGVAVFTNSAAVLQDLTGDIDLLRGVINTLAPQGGTNLGAGMEMGNAILAQSAPGESRILVLLSDGMSNAGMSNDQILTGPVQTAVQAGTCLYTVGFGDPGDLDEDLLVQIAAASQRSLGCGQYFYASDMSALESIYIRIRHQSTGNILGQFNGNVTQGQTVQAGSVSVPPGQGELAISLHWPGSRMELILHDPNGNTIQPGDPNLRLNTYNNLVYALVMQPTPGNWLVDVLGAEIPVPNEPFEVLVSARPAPITPTPSVTATPVSVKLPKPKSAGVETALIILLLGGGGVALYVYATVLRRRRAGGATVPAGGALRPCSLLITSGPLNGSELPINGAQASIGRGAANQVVLPDQAVSRLHAILRSGQGEWFLQDQNSRSGTFVNGQRVAAVRLSNGDRILLGATEMVFKLR